MSIYRHHLSESVLPCIAAGKSELINSLLGRPVLSTSAFRDATKRIRVVKGSVAGAALQPAAAGLTVAAAAAAPGSSSWFDGCSRCSPSLFTSHICQLHMLLTSASCTCCCQIFRADPEQTSAHHALLFMQLYMCDFQIC
jgi:hypothetical protein